MKRVKKDWNLKDMLEIINMRFYLKSIIQTEIKEISKYGKVFTKKTNTNYTMYIRGAFRGLYLSGQITRSSFERIINILDKVDNREIISLKK